MRCFLFVHIRKATVAREGWIAFNPHLVSRAGGFVMTLRSVWNWLLLPVVLLGLLGFGSLAEASDGKSGPKLYGESSDWRVYLDEERSSCSLALRFETVYFLFNSVTVGGITKYHVSFGSNDFSPEDVLYRYEIKNENSTLMSMQGRGFRAPAGIGYVMVGPFDADVLGAFANSKTLHVKTDGIGGGDYRLGRFRKGFALLYDCLKDLKGGKPSAPEARRMN